MRKLVSRSTLAAATLAIARAAQASGDSGTSSVSEMDVGPREFFMILGGVVGMGVLVWIVLKVLSRKK